MSTPIADKYEHWRIQLVDRILSYVSFQLQTDYNDLRTLRLNLRLQ